MRPRGFTLVEILVVLVLTGILTAMIGLSLVRRDSDRLREEAERLGLLLRAAREEAILTGQPYWVQFQSDGYRFLTLSADGKLHPASDGMFRSRALDSGVVLQQSLHPGETGSTARQGIALLPTGETAEATIILLLGKMKRAVTLKAGGEISISGDE